MLVSSGDFPFFEWPASFPAVDIFYANGVLHHSPKLAEILLRVRRMDPPVKEMRLMLYNEKFWKQNVKGSEIAPAFDVDVSRHRDFREFVRNADAVGHYADFYTRQKLAWHARGLWAVKEWVDICSHQGYSAVTLKPLHDGLLIDLP